MGYYSVWDSFTNSVIALVIMTSHEIIIVYDDGEHVIPAYDSQYATFMHHHFNIVRNGDDRYYITELACIQ